MFALPILPRMKPTLLSVLLAALIVPAMLPLRASPLDDRISELKHAIEKEASAKNGNGPNPQGGFVNPGMNPAFINASIDQMVQQMENPQFGGNMDAQIAQITSVYTSEEVQEATTNLLNEIHKERKDRTDSEVAALKSLMTRAGQAITQAKKPEDLDALISEMGNHENSRYGGNSALQGQEQLVQQFASAFEFVKQWQNYLAHLNNGQTSEARADLQNLSQNNYGSNLIPRSKLLALQAPDKLASPGGAAPGAGSTPVAQAQAILDGIKTLDDIQPALDKLEPLRQANMGELQNVYFALAQVQQSYQNLKAGLPGQINLNAGYGNGPTVPAGVRAQLLLLGLQNRFATFKGRPPAPTEKPADFVDRVIADATSREDWELLHNAVEARQSLRQQSGTGYAMAYANGVDGMIAGAHLEDAGQWALAVQSYETALRSADPAVPAKVIGEKLAAIQRDHPKEFADGMQLVVSPPSPRVYQRPEAFNSNYPPASIPASLLSPATTNAAPATATAPPPAAK